MLHVLPYAHEERFWPTLTSAAHTKSFVGIEFPVAMTQLHHQRIMKPFASLGRLLYGRTVLDIAGIDLAHLD